MSNKSLDGVLTKKAHTREKFSEEQIQDLVECSNSKTGFEYFAKKFCNLNEHRFDIKQEVIAKSGLFVTKKRYGLKIINDNGKKVDKMMVKGLDTVRSSFPVAMRTMLSKLLEDILMDVPKDKLDKFIINFKDSMKLMDFDKIAIPTGVKNVDKTLPPICATISSGLASAFSPEKASINLSIKYNPVPALVPKNTDAKPFKSNPLIVPSLCLLTKSATNK